MSDEQNDDKPIEVRQAMPWDLLNPTIVHVNDQVRDERLAVCRGCEFFMSKTQQCRKCLCIMPLKTKLPHAYCPEGKWGAVATPPVE